MIEPLIPLIRLDITSERNRHHKNPYIHVIPFEMPYLPFVSLRQLTVICTPLCNKTISVTSCTKQKRISGSRNEEYHAIWN